MSNIVSVNSFAFSPDYWKYTNGATYTTVTAGLSNLNHTVNVMRPLKRSVPVKTLKLPFQSPRVAGRIQL